MFTIPAVIKNPDWQKMNEAYRMDESLCVENLLTQLQWSTEARRRISEMASHLVEGIRARRLSIRGLDSFVHEYDLSTEEGVILMCLAEALLRVPDKENINRLIRDKISKADWSERIGKSDSFFVNAATWGLMLTGKILSPAKTGSSVLAKGLKRFVEKSSEPVIRKSVLQAMRILGKQFVMGQTIEEALKRAIKFEAEGYRFSYDMLGEAARTSLDAERYFQAYQASIAEIRNAAKSANLYENPGISVKLSALHPRYEVSNYVQAVQSITEKLLILAQQCKEANIPLTVDAEESDRLDLSLMIIENVFAHDSLENWLGFGLAVQAYQKRAWFLIDWLVGLASRHHKRLMIRLIKGAYWDSEIKITQEKGLEGYPVFTRKNSTDVSFLACAKKILQHTDVIYPMFATHNAHSVASILEMAGDYRDFEFQCLHGMGATLYDQIVPKEKIGQPCRVYAPVGSHEDLLPYLVRRLLENGANSSFVNRISDVKLPIASIIADPAQLIEKMEQIPNPYIPLPSALYKRLNSGGIDLSNFQELQKLQENLIKANDKIWQAKPSSLAEAQNSGGVAIYNPANIQQLVGWVQEATIADVKKTLDCAQNYFNVWSRTSVLKRADLLEKAAEILEQHRDELIALLIREAGKTVPDAIGEVREAIDFCYYYAVLARQTLMPLNLEGYTGESNQLYFKGRGVMVCISPWNFPLAIFTGQIVAALVAGNSVIAKPAEQTPLIAARTLELFYQAGIPKNALQLLPGSGEVVGSALVSDLRVKGILFTGSTETARIIQNSLVQRGGPIVPFIAETGGQNAMIADSSALPEQLVQDILTSAFYSAGQRCSALRVLFVQNEIADKVINMLKGAMDELRIGDPVSLTTDIGPVIDQEALKILEKHAQRMDVEAKCIHKASFQAGIPAGHYFAPRAYEISSISVLEREVFGPILHIVRFEMAKLDQIIESINQTGYGLTFGIHSRIEETIEYITSRIHAGNIYVNRNMIGAVVGVQPFGGEGLSGTGPKAGGPNYLLRLVTEQTICVNTTAAGGNATLMAMGESAST